MRKAWRAAVTWVAAAAAVTAGAGAAHGAQTGADAGFSFTAEKYAAVPFGTDRATVWQMVVGAAQSPPPGSASGWCENSSMTIQCFTASGDYVPYGNFNFNAAGTLVSKQNEFLYKPAAPSMTLAKYNKVQLGMTEAQFWAVVPSASCVVREEAYPNWPATTGHKLAYKCDASTGLFPPVAYFDLTDGKVTYKYQRALT
ncbi:BLIP family protein [Streptomyces sp. LMG1-1-1.1]|uniref:BLIP family protein n=1 Tax=Streptomyces sp. LMG1-1-1.1 TaxID=3135245 RepID=UPI003465F88B